MTEWRLLPEEIERRSFAIIEAEAPAHNWSAPAWRIIRRMIHTTADFDYVRSVKMHPQAIAAGLSALQQGRSILTDTRMLQAGISKRKTADFGIKIDCLIDHPEVAELAGRTQTTRAAASVDFGLQSGFDGIYAIGNAPTALFRLLELIAAGRTPPTLIIGLPVGFVNAAEAKAALLASGATCITNLGRKGGSAVAASVINALVDLAGD